MATVAELIQNVEKIRNFVGVYLSIDNPTKKQRDSLAIDLGQLDRNLAALTSALRAPVAVVPVAPVVSVVAMDVAPPPNFGESDAMSSGLYNEWVTAWITGTFPEAYRDWPPTVYGIDHTAIVAAAKEDECLAQVCAAGVLGIPGGVWDALGDWSLFTAVASTSVDGGFLHQVFHMGDLVGETVSGPGDGLEYAASLGFNW
jgi:hypothetical protein